MAGNPYSPEQVDEAIQAIRAGAMQTCTEWAKDGQAHMRANADWTDRGGKDSLTGKTARESLEAEAGWMDDGVTIQVVFRSTRANTHLWHGNPAPVGAFLELGTRRMHRHPVIHDTLEQDTPQLRADLTKMLASTAG